MKKILITTRGLIKSLLSKADTIPAFNLLFTGVRIGGVLLLFFLSFTFGIEGKVFAQSKFQLTIGGSGNGFEYASSIIQTSTGGYAFVGTTSSFGAGDYDIYIITLDASGSIQWTKTVGGTGREWGRSITQTSDGGYAICGSTNSFSAGDNDVFIIKVDASSNLEWSKTIGGTAADGANCIIQTSDGGLAVAGQTFSYGAGQADIYIVKLDVSGALQWSKTIGGIGSDFASSVIQTTDGGYAVAGYTNSFGAGGNDLYIIKLDTNGELQWSTTAGGTANDLGQCIVQTSEGGYAVTGWCGFGAGGADVYVVKLNSSGALQWTRTVGGTGYDIGRSIIQAADGGYAVAGWTNSFGSQPRPNDVYVVKLSGGGSLQWSKVLGSTNMIDEAYDIIQTSDGKYIIAGETAYLGSTVDCYLVKLDGNGNTCGSSTKPKSLSGTGGTITSCVSSVSSQIPSVTDQTPIVSSGGTVTTICSQGNSPLTKNEFEENTLQPSQFQLEQNYPNPFNPSTKISYSLPTAEFVTLKVFDILGNEVVTLVNEEKNPGVYEVTFNASELTSGIYFYKLHSGNYIETKKMVLAK